MVKKILLWLHNILKKESPEEIPTPNPTDKGVYITSGEARNILMNELGDVFRDNADIYFLDKEYYCPSVEYVKNVLAKNKLDEETWVAAVTVCDGFAKVLWAVFEQDNWRSGTRRKAHCFGFMGGRLPNPHAINFFIGDDKHVHFVEPQNDTIYKRDYTIKEIWLMIA